MIHALPLSYAATMGVRAYLGCALLQTQIHCFGGFTSSDSRSSSTYTNAAADHFYIDMATFDFTDISNALSDWTVIQDDSPLEVTGFVQTASFNQSKLLIYGGSNNGGTNLRNPFMEFDSSSRSWTTLATHGNYTRFGSLIALDDSQKVWTWYLSSWPSINLAFSSQHRNTAFNVTSSVYEFDFQKLQWIQFPGEPNTYTRYQHSSTLIPSRNIIYIIGGMNRNPGGVDFGADMLEIRTFDTVASTWGAIRGSVGNSQNITSRVSHTATYIANTNVFLIYGGDASDTVDTTVLTDYAYLYDYTNNVYTLLNFESGQGAGARTGHAAVAYESYVMIMFGVNSKHELLQDVHVLNMTNATSPAWVGTPLPSPSSSSVSKSGLSSGAIAGIVVAAVVASIVLTAALIFMMYRTRKQQKELELEATDPRRASLTKYMILSAKSTAYCKPTMMNQEQTLTNKDCYPITKTPMVPTGSKTVSSAGGDTLFCHQSVDSTIKPTSQQEPSKPYSADESTGRAKPNGDC
ncbi:hypothetical protein [Absidia glauca]|uniref:Attractin/MKLN-like beta-propeller domain-containing protein n=1 Tax=Absidia glauca TaxID=4829 RepID=A0A163KUT2_ABSGL|nr:hypothetical protein [Absidia glauca]